MQAKAPIKKKLLLSSNAKRKRFSAKDEAVNRDKFIDDNERVKRQRREANRRGEDILELYTPTSAKRKNR